MRTGMQMSTAREVAAFLRMKETTVCSLASQGKLPAFKIGKSWRFDMDRIELLFTGSMPTERQIDPAEERFGDLSARPGSPPSSIPRKSPARNSPPPDRQSFDETIRDLTIPSAATGGRRFRVIGD